ncbi:MAG: hypothetical protein ACM3PP_02140 [Candidatus Saccharibacteria bacterium]
MIERPYFRISRNSWPDYVLDSRYSDDMAQLCRAFGIIIKDLERLFEFVEPTNDNLDTYSHRTYELFLRTATEFETNCKRILLANGYKKKQPSIVDYAKIDKASRLSDYEVVVTNWSITPKEYRPFVDWKNGHSLAWYQDYNSVKHDRSVHFPKASLGNLVESITGLLVILFSQFGIYALSPNQDVAFELSNDDGYCSAPGSMFAVKPPTWTDDERYSFDWDTLSTLPMPFQMFNFND